MLQVQSNTNLLSELSASLNIQSSDHAMLLIQSSLVCHALWTACGIRHSREEAARSDEEKLC